MKYKAEKQKMDLFGNDSGGNVGFIRKSFMTAVVIKVLLSMVVSNKYHDIRNAIKSRGNGK